MTAEDFIGEAVGRGDLTYTDIADLVRYFQLGWSAELAVDGMPGALTLASLHTWSSTSRWGARHPQSINPALPPKVSKLESAGLKALAEAARLWKLDVYDPQKSDKSPAAQHSRAVIDSILQASGWTWETPYLGDGQVEWCGLFAGACWRAAGLEPDWLGTYFPSTYRLDLWANYRAFPGGKPNPQPADPTTWRLVANLDRDSKGLPWAPRAGDILTVGDGLPAQGDHICIVESFDASTGIFKTYEGNGTGVGPDGKRRQGIVRGERKLGGAGYCARRLIRPAESDLL